ncbi:hypothetical protein CVT25_000222 [Psilocybe cyanescens]|uniref:Uncharacterized protein n=1 Tax=Psilocybe cyanescens TaxID=93625 RepID=A0A409XQ89_PSICY|nr:hypothetical protein CVT25_000222 [Psilocybe cyanescens]
MFQEAGTRRISPLTTLENGMTRYEVEMIRSLFAYKGDDDKFQTVLNTPITRTFIHEQDVSRMYISATAEVSGGVEVLTPQIETDCSMDLENMAADCVSKDLDFVADTIDGVTRTTSYIAGTYTYPMRLVPLATFTAESTSGSSGSFLPGSTHTVLLVGSASLLSFLIAL